MNEPLIFSADPGNIDFPFLSAELAGTYWGENRTTEKLKRIAKNCFVMSVFRESEQIGFGRVVTDYETYAYVMDVIVKESERGKGLGKKIMTEIIDHPRMSNIEAYSLKTKDAGGFYETLGFKLETTERYVLIKKDWDNQSEQDNPITRP